MPADAVTAARPPAEPVSPGSSRRLLGVVRFLAIELLLWGSLYGIYLIVRSLTVGSWAQASANARLLVDLQKDLRLFHEPAVQAALEAVHGPLSLYYMLGFAPFTVGVLVWLAVRDRDRYAALRTVLLLSIGLALAVHVAFPVAPPRLMPDLGIADTVGLSAREASFMGVRFNPYAAVPSMHVGWSLLVAIIGYRASRRVYGRVLFPAHPLSMAVAVVATGNHYFLDVLAGVAVALLALALCSSLPLVAFRLGVSPTTRLALTRPAVSRWPAGSQCTAARRWSRSSPAREEVSP